jgi:hypothetical protein
MKPANRASTHRKFKSRNGSSGYHDCRPSMDMHTIQARSRSRMAVRMNIRMRQFDFNRGKGNGHGHGNANPHCECDRIYIYKDTLDFFSTFRSDHLHSHAPRTRRAPIRSESQSLTARGPNRRDLGCLGLPDGVKGPVSPPGYFCWGDAWR